MRCLSVYAFLLCCFLLPSGAEEASKVVGALNANVNYVEPDWRAFREHQKQVLAEVKAPVVPAGEHENPVDNFLAKWYEKKNVTPGAPSEDTVFLRRAYLDIVGLLPSVDELRGFQKDEALDKRERLVERLLADRQAYAEHWMTFWNDLLRNDEQTSIDGLRKPVTRWLYESLLSNKPYDLMVAQLLNPKPEDGPEGFLRGVQWRGAINASQRPVIQAAQSVSQVFLSTAMKCASCHDHFTKQWKLADTYGLAACFSEEGKLDLFRCDKPTGGSVQAAFPFKELGTVDPNADVFTRRQQAAQLVVSPKNPRFARAIVNRLWHRLMGQGLFEPVDDLDYDPIYPALLNWLAYDFMAHDFDLKRPLHLILTSQAYQRASLPSAAELVAEPDYLAPRIRRLQSEQFMDGIFQVTGYVPKTKTMDVDVDNNFARSWRYRVPSLLATALGRPNREQVTSVRVQEATVLQMLEMVNGAYFSQMLQDAAEFILDRSPYAEHPDKLTDMLFLRAYSRPPCDEEKEQFVEMLALNDKKKIPQAALEDALWILFMSPEFQFVQ